jgi:hypothetical protein
LAPEPAGCEPRRAARRRDADRGGSGAGGGLGLADAGGLRRLAAGQDGDVKPLPGMADHADAVDHPLPVGAHGQPAVLDRGPGVRIGRRGDAAGHRDGAQPGQQKPRGAPLARRQPAAAGAAGGLPETSLGSEDQIAARIACELRVSACGAARGRRRSHETRM